MKNYSKQLALVLIVITVLSGCGKYVTNLDLHNGEDTGGENISIESTEFSLNDDSMDASCYGKETENSNCDEAKKSQEDAWSFISNINVGWNLGDSLEAYAPEYGYDANLDAETRWGNPVVTKELIDYVASLGFNTIRIPITWMDKCGRTEDGRIIVGEKWLTRIHQVVDYAIENDMYVIINTMHDSQSLFRCGVTDDAEWELILDDAGELWRQIASSFANYDEQLVFEAYNEVGNSEKGFLFSELAAIQMNVLNQAFVDAVRESGGKNRERILIVPTLFNGTLTNVLDSFQLPYDTEADKLVVTVHCYENDFAQDIEWKFEALENFSDNIGAPILIGEFGARDDYAPIAWREKFTSNYISRAKEHGIKCCVWDDGYHWKLIDRREFRKTDTKMIRAIFDGIEGKKFYINNDKRLVLRNLEDFYFGSMNWDKGIMQSVDYKNKYWAVLTTIKGSDQFLEVENANYISVSMTTRGDATNFWLYCIYFMDEHKKLISYSSAKNIMHRYVCVEVPPEAKFYMVNTFDPYNNHTLEQIKEYFDKDYLEMRITLINKNDIDLLHEEFIRENRY